MKSQQRSYPMVMKLAGLVVFASTLVALHYGLLSMAAKIGADTFLLPKIAQFVTRETLKVFVAGSREGLNAGLYSFWASLAVAACVFLMLVELWWPHQSRKAPRALDKQRKGADGSFLGSKDGSAQDGERA